jgi:hypothetical protein
MKGRPRAIILRRGGQATGKGDSKFPGISAQRKPMLPQEGLGSLTGAEAVQVSGQMRVSLSQSLFSSSYITCSKQEITTALLGSYTTQGRKEH